MNDVNHLNWIPISFAKPEPRQSIYGAAAARPLAGDFKDAVIFAFWQEDWDEDEPLGSMTHWQPAD